MLVPLDIPPGYNTEDSDYATGPRWVGGDHVRFRNGRPEKIGGYQLATDETFAGAASHALGWTDLTNVGKISLATTEKLYIYYGGTFYDITPVDDSGTLGTDPFTTTNGSAVVSVAHTNHGRNIGDYVSFSGASAAGGITISGEYQVASVTDGNNYTITHSAAATSAATGGGAAVAYSYLLPIGNDVAYFGYGFGSGSWGEGTWGTPRDTSTIALGIRAWTLDNWGEDLIANPREGGIYIWDASVGTGTRATQIANAPNCRSILVSPTDRHLLAFGAVPQGGSDIDPMLIRWCDQEDYDTWTAAATNTAGDLRLTDGSYIVGAVRTRNEILVWTDNALYSLQYLGPPYTFGAVQIATGCGMAGIHSAVEFGGAVYWFGKNCRHFYKYDGRLQIIPCPILNYIQDDINIVQSDQIYACAYKDEGEIKWLFCSEGATTADREAIYNVLQNVWYYNSISRSVWLDKGSGGIATPIAFDHNGQVWAHEIGTDDGDNALAAHIESGTFEIAQGDDMMHISRLIPDFQNLDGSAFVTLYTRRYPNSVDITKGPYTVTSSTEKVSVRARGRQVRIRVESTARGDDWRLGKMRLDIIPNGAR